jgi:hypothetical protein
MNDDKETIYWYGKTYLEATFFLPTPYQRPISGIDTA